MASQEPKPHGLSRVSQVDTQHSAQLFKILILYRYPKILSKGAWRRPGYLEASP